MKTRRFSYLWNLRGLSGTRFSFYNDDAVLVHGLLQLVKKLVNGKLLSLLQNAVVFLGKGDIRQRIGLRLEDEVRRLREATTFHSVRRRERNEWLFALFFTVWFSQHFICFQNEPIYCNHS